MMMTMEMMVLGMMAMTIMTMAIVIAMLQASDVDAAAYAHDGHSFNVNTCAFKNISSALGLLVLDAGD